VSGATDATDTMDEEGVEPMQLDGSDDDNDDGNASEDTGPEEEAQAATPDQHVVGEVQNVVGAEEPGNLQLGGTQNVSECTGNGVATNQSNGAVPVPHSEAGPSNAHAAKRPA